MAAGEVGLMSYLDGGVRAQGAVTGANRLPSPGRRRRSLRAGAGLADLDPAPAGVRKVIDGHFMNDSKQAQGYPPPSRRLLAYLN